MNISRCFIENTKQYEESEIFYVMDKIEPAKNKKYPTKRSINLQKYKSLSGNIGKILKKRRSIRNYTNKIVTINDISKLLMFTCGISDKKQHFRLSPSAGAKYPLETYLVVFKAKKLSPGLYYYDYLNHSLVLLKKGQFNNKICHFFSSQEMVKTAGLSIIITAICDKTMLKYKDRGMRYIFLDAGHLGQNLYLVATALGLKPVSIGGFLDSAICSFLHINEKHEIPVYGFVIGK